jgi:hypothetical protein
MGRGGAILGSLGYLELFLNQGNLARQWAVIPGAPVILEAPD